jgi:hypothetical protein
MRLRIRMTCAFAPAVVYLSMNTRIYALSRRLRDECDELLRECEKLRNEADQRLRQPPFWGPSSAPEPREPLPAVEEGTAGEPGETDRPTRGDAD